MAKALAKYTDDELKAELTRRASLTEIETLPIGAKFKWPKDGSFRAAAENGWLCMRLDTHGSAKIVSVNTPAGSNKWAEPSYYWTPIEGHDAGTIYRADIGERVKTL